MEQEFKSLREKELEREMEGYRLSPKYGGLAFTSVQQTVEVMTGQKLQSWDELYTNPIARVDRNLDFQHLQSIGVQHYLWQYGWQNVDRIEVDIRGDGRIAPDFEERKPGFLRIFRQPNLDQIVEINIAYEIPDLNRRGYKESMSIYLRRCREEEQGIHRLVLRSVAEYSFFVRNLGMVLQSGGGIGLDNDNEEWDNPRYADAFKEILNLLKVKEVQ